jgi:hypothetical protein
VEDSIATDLAGRPRIVDDPRTRETGPPNDSAIDLGAYEYQPAAPRRRAVRP